VPYVFWGDAAQLQQYMGGNLFFWMSIPTSGDPSIE